MEQQRRRFRITPINTPDDVDLTISTSIRRPQKAPSEQTPAPQIDPPSLGNLQLEKNEPQKPTDSIPLSIMNLLQESMVTKITEMVHVHKEIVKEMIKKDQEREQRIRDLVTDLAQLNQENTSLQIENQKLKEILACRH